MTLMTRMILCAAAVPALLLAGCEPAQPPEDGNRSTPTEANAARPTPMAAPTPAPAIPEATPVPEPSPDPAATVPELTPEAERGEKGARNLLLGFARSVEQKQFDRAWSLLSPADKRKWSRAAFAKLFADLDRITVAMPSGTMEGAAGSSYYNAPVSVTGTDKDGRSVRLEGEAVLRRVNDVDGATAEQRRWHFETLTLDWTH
ncbi:hypothetical protein [Sphingomonas rustica]